MAAMANKVAQTRARQPSTGRGLLIVNWFEIEIINTRGETTYRNSFVTDLPVGPDTVVELAACGRARWKIENETIKNPRSKLRGIGGRKEADQKNAASCGEYVPQEIQRSEKQRLQP